MSFIEKPKFDISFYLPFQQDNISSIPTNIDDYWDWVCTNSSMAEGKYSWTLQTFLQFRKAGIPCNLKTEMPKKGIVVTHRDFLPIHQIPYPDLFVVCIKPDRKAHPWAQQYITQNHSDPILHKLSPDRVSKALSWPQPSLIPRNENRGTLIENIAYLGRLNNLEPELQTAAWKEEMHSLGFNWQFIPMAMWNDYSNIDVTVSIRGWKQTESKQDAVIDWNSKPPNKLTNSWLANVPAIVGDEPSFQSIQGAGQDYLLARNSDELKSALLSLRSNHDHYRNLQKRGTTRATEYSVAAVQTCWQNLIQEDIFHAYENWMKLSPFKRQSINLARMFHYFGKVRNLIDPLAGVTRSLRK